MDTPFVESYGICLLRYLLRITAIQKRTYKEQNIIVWSDSQKWTF